MCGVSINIYDEWQKVIWIRYGPQDNISAPTMVPADVVIASAHARGLTFLLGLNVQPPPLAVLDSTLKGPDLTTSRDKMPKVVMWTKAVIVTR